MLVPSWICFTIANNRYVLFWEAPYIKQHFEHPLQTRLVIQILLVDFLEEKFLDFIFLCVSVSEFAQTICKTSLMDIVTFIFQVYFMYLWMI